MSSLSHSTLLRALRLMSCALATVVIAACSAHAAYHPTALDDLVVAAPLPTSSWPMYQHDASHNAYFSKRNFARRWIAQLGGRVNGGLAVVGDRLYLDSFDRHLYAIDLSTGAIRWKAALDNIVMSTPVIAVGRVIVGTGRDGFSNTDPHAQIWARPKGDDIVAFDANTGRRIWSFHTVGEDMPSPAIVGKTVVFANGDLHAYGLDVVTGRLLWRRALPGIATMASTTAVSNKVFIGLCHNMPHFRKTLALDVRNGRMEWANPNGSCDASATVSNGLVLVDGNDEKTTGVYSPGGRDIIAAVDEGSGKTIWQRVGPQGPYTAVASGEHAIAGTVADGVLYQSVVNEDVVLALDSKSGKLLWRTATSGPVKMSPVVTANRVIFGDTAGVLYDIERTTGHVLDTQSFTAPFSTSPPIVVGDTLLIANGRDLLAMPINGT